MFIGQASGNYNETRVSSALSSTYRSKPPYSATHATHLGNQFVNMAQSPASPSSADHYYQQQHRGTIHTKRRRNQNSSAVDNQIDNTQLSINNEQQLQERRQNISHPSFFHSYHSLSGPSHAIVDSGACAQLVEESTLKAIQTDPGIKLLDAAKRQQALQRFGKSPNGQSTLYAVKIPFMATVQNKQIIVFYISPDVIAGKLPALDDAPTLTAMRSNINFKNLMFGLAIGQ